MELIILALNPNERDYAWMQSLRRPGWLGFHVWSPLIRLACYLGVYLSLLLVHGKDHRWSWVIVYLAVIGLSEAGVSITCQMRSLTLGSSLGAAAGIAALVLAYLIHPSNPLASLALMPFLAWSAVDNLAQLQMKSINGQVMRREPSNPSKVEVAASSPLDPWTPPGGERRPR